MGKIKLLKDKDDAARAILQALQHYGRLSVTEISKRVNLSGPAVSERIKKMEDDGIITGYTANIDHDKVGLTVNAFILLKSSLPHSTVIKKLESVPEILECYNITGSHCIIMKVATANTKKLEKIINMLQQLGETNTSIILSESFSKRPACIDQ